jgi:hypothetical protein
VLVTTVVLDVNWVVVGDVDVESVLDVNWVVVEVVDVESVLDSVV